MLLLRIVSQNSKPSAFDGFSQARIPTAGKTSHRDTGLPIQPSSLFRTLLVFHGLPVLVVNEGSAQWNNQGMSEPTVWWPLLMSEGLSPNKSWPAFTLRYVMFALTTGSQPKSPSVPSRVTCCLRKTEFESAVSLNPHIYTVYTWYPKKTTCL